MLLDFLVGFFVNHLSMEDCVKLFAGLLMINDKELQRKDALEQAKLSEREDLKYKLIRLINYGPD